MAFYIIYPEVYRHDDKLVLSFDLPGRKRESITVKIEDGQLRIRAPHDVRRNIAYAYNMPTSVNRDEVSAEYKNGVLTIELPFKPEDQGRKIEVR